MEDEGRGDHIGEREEEDEEEDEVGGDGEAHSDGKLYHFCHIL